MKIKIIKINLSEQTITLVDKYARNKIKHAIIKLSIMRPVNPTLYYDLICLLNTICRRLWITLHAPTLY